MTTNCCHNFRYETVVTISDKKPMSLKLITVPRDEFAIGGEKKWQYKILPVIMDVTLDA